MWNDVLYKSFEAWAKITKEEARSRLLTLRMLYWRVQRTLRVWRLKVVITSSLKTFFRYICELHTLHKKRRCFKHWNLMRKIHNACHLTSDAFKSKALALTMVRIGRFNIMRSRFFSVWKDEIKLDLKLIWAFEWHCMMLKKQSFFIWRDNSIQRNLKRKEAEHKRWAITAIQSIQVSKSDNNEVDKPKPQQPSLKNSQQAAKVSQARAKIASQFDKEVLKKQQNDRRMRYKREKLKLSDDWKHKWNKIEKDRVVQIVDKTNKWLTTKQGQNDVLKELRRIESLLKSPPPCLSQSNLIALSLLDGKLGQKGILVDSFLGGLRERTDDEDMIRQDEFEHYLITLGIRMTPSLVREIFNEVELKDKAKRKIHLHQIENRFKETYQHFGTQGSRYKKYISQCHGMITFHDVYTNMVRYTSLFLFPLKYSLTLVLL